MPGRECVRMVAVDDEPACLELIEDALAQEGLEIFTVTDPRKGWDLIRQVSPELVLLDLRMPGMNGMELLERIQEWRSGIDVILLTGDYSTESAVEAIRKGACDYLTKPVDVEVLARRVERLLADIRRRKEAFRLEGQLLEASRFESMVGHSPQMMEVFAWVRRVAPHYRVALIRGETGTGKELVAQALHNQSPVAGARFVVCNCSAVVETLFESELFGHVRGAFTGAVQDRLGLFEYANGGTLFLDEVGDLPMSTQSKLLRALQNQEVQRVGSPVVRNVDVRVVAATNRDLNTMMAEKEFREDLYYRLSMVEIELPRLADRKEDLPLLTQHFLERFAAQYSKPVRVISRRAQAALARCHWPGNVRQLENVIGHACMMAQGDTIDVCDLPSPLRANAPEPMPRMEEEKPMPLAEAERRYVRRVLEQIGGNKVQTAKTLGISRATLYRILGEPGDSSAGL